jgi:alpha-glucosidase (family GH31 glycosyl hydrolase)
VSFPGDRGSLRLTVCRPGIVRVARAAAGSSSSPSLVGPRDWPDTPFDVVDGEPVRLDTSVLRLEVESAPRRLSFADPTGAWMLREAAEGGMDVERATGRVRADFAFSGEQHFYGLGQGGGRLDRLGTARQVWNSHLGHGPGSDTAVPLLLSSRGYALFFDNPADAAIAVGRSDDGVRIVYTAARGPLVWYFLAASNLRGLVGEVTELLGRPPLPPRWALGFLRSTRHFDDTAELRRLPRTIPLDRLPLLVRAGAILPLGPVVQHTGERALDELTLQVYPEGASRLEPYEDDGRSNAYRQGHHALTPIECVAEAGRVTVRTGVPVGDPSITPADRRYLLRLKMARPAAVALEGGGELLAAGGDADRRGWWMDEAGFLCVRPLDRPSIAVVVTLEGP